MKLSKLTPNPENPRRISEWQLERLANSIRDFEKMMELRPIVVDENGFILGGNQRFLALQTLGYEEIPDNWVKVAKDLTAEERRRFIIQDNVSSGSWDTDLLSLNFDIPELEDWGLHLDCFDGGDVEPDPEDKRNIYSGKIDAPIYEPSGDKPKVEELTDPEQYKELLEVVQKAGKLPKELRAFLELACSRFIKFNYDKIAEFYAHANKEEQDLFERLALVIIDFEKAIENGFIRVTKEVLDQYQEEYVNESNG